MNFLPFVLMFFLVFGAISASFMSDHIMNRAESFSYKGRVRSLRIAYNDYEEKVYETLRAARKASQKKTRGRNKKAQSTEEREVEPSEKEYFRTTRSGSPYGAIYLKTLCTGRGDRWLEKVTIHYLKRVYANSHFAKSIKDQEWVEKVFYSILEQERSAYREKGKFLPLNKLSMPNDLKEAYHRLLRGTGTFDPTLEKGYLPLDLCITFKGSNRKAINIHYANRLLLETLFGKSGFSLIKAEEWPKSEKWPKGGPREKAGKSAAKYSLNCKELKKLLKDKFEEAYSHIGDTPYKRDPKRACDPETFVFSEIENE